jgi:hypothetical protein
MIQMPDYTKQLDEIVRVLNRPGTSQWVIALFSALLGLIAGLIGQTLQTFLADVYRCFKMRRVLYIDLADMFLNVDSIITADIIADGLERSKWQEDQLRQHLLFRGEKYCLDTQEIYMQLSERPAAEILYQRFHLILNEEMHVNTGLALRMFANAVHNGSLQPKYINRFCGRKQAANVLRKVAHYLREDDDLRTVQHVRSSWLPPSSGPGTPATGG